MGYKEARAMLDREEQSQKEFERKMGGAKVLVLRGELPTIDKPLDPRPDVREQR